MFTAFKGPIVGFGRARIINTPGAPDYNENEPAPSLVSAYGWGWMDTRPQFAYQPDQPGRFFMSNVQGLVLDQAPSQLANNNIAASQTPVANQAMTLVSSSGAGITVGVSIINQLTGAAVTVLAIDGAMVPVDLGAAAGLTSGGAGWASFWDPTLSVARGVRIHSVGNDTTATFTVRGFDLYGFPLTETITGANGADAVGVKAFKYILSVTPAGTLSGSAAYVGTTDLFGIPLYVSGWAYLSVWW